MLQLEHRPSKLLITGRSGTGKTTYFVRYALNTAARLRFVFDHEGEFFRRLRVRPAATVDELAAAVSTGWVIFDPAGLFPGRTAAAFEFFCHWSFQLSTVIGGRKLFCCDELQKLVGTNQISPGMALVLETGRRYGLDAAMIAQQPNLVHNRIRNQLTEVVTFQQMDDAALNFLEQAGFVAEQVRGLRPGQWIARNLNSQGEARGRVF